MHLKRTFIVLEIALLLLLHMACAAPGVGYMTYTISGKVSGSWQCWDPTGCSPEPSTITLLPLNKTAYFTRVGTPFSFRNMPAGDYILAVSCGSSQLKQVPVTVAGKNVYVDLVLPYPELPQRKPVTVLTGHKSFISDLAFSPDGASIISVSQNGLLIRWNLVTGKKTQALQIEPVGYDTFLALSPDGTVLASGEDNGVVRLWNTAQGEILHALQGFDGPVEGIAFSPDIATVVAWRAGGSGKVALWNTATGESLYSLDVSQGRQFEEWERKFVTFAQDGTALISVTGTGGYGSESDLKIAWWDVATASNLKTLTVPEPVSNSSGILSVAVSSDETRFAFGGEFLQYGSLAIWDVSTDDGINRQHIVSVRQLGFSPNGDFVASTSLDNTVILWDVATGEPCHILVSDSESIDQFAWSPDGKLLAAGDGKGRVLIWETP